MNWRDYIHSNPSILGGKPTIKGIGISVKSMLAGLATGKSVNQILASYPDLTHEAVQACLLFAIRPD